MGRNAGTVAQEQFSRDVQAKKVLKVLENVNV
jgi:hypothetical protein